MIKKADSKLIKMLNETQIMNLIREESPIARVELARRTQMSKVAVFEIINRLIRNGYVEDFGKGQSTDRGGKRPSLVKLNTSVHFVIGIEIRRREALLAVADLEANILKMKSFAFEVGSPADSVIEKMFKRIDTMLTDLGIRAAQLVSIAIGLPGLIDYKKGELRFADTLKGWDYVPIRQKIHERYNVPVIIENDVNTIALGESVLGVGKDYQDQVCIWVGEGVGAAVIVQGQLVKGFSGSAGEIGYLEINQHCDAAHRFKYLYKNQRYFGEILSELNLQDVIVEVIQNKTGKKLQKMSLFKILKSEEYKNYIEEVLDEYAFALGILCLDMIKIINPRLLILSGKIVENSPYLVSKVREFIRQKTREIPLDADSIEVGLLKDEAGIRGALALALEVVFGTKMARSARNV